VAKPIQTVHAHAPIEAIDNLCLLFHIQVVTHSAWLCVAFNGAMSCDEEDEDMQEWFHTGEMRSTVLEFFSNAHQN